jgi:hypothetical protein
MGGGMRNETLFDVCPRDTSFVAEWILFRWGAAFPVHGAEHRLVRPIQREARASSST